MGAYRIHTRCYAQGTIRDPIGQDILLQGATFIAVDARGIGDRRPTGADGKAMIHWPGGSVGQVTLRMEPPKDSGYTLIGPQDVTRSVSADFFFAPPSAPGTPTR